MENKFELLCQGDSRLLRINASKGENYFIEPGTMVGMSPTWDLNIKTGGLGKLVGRMVTGESVLLQEYRALADGELLVAPYFSGDLLAVEVGERQYRISNGNFLACSGGVSLKTKAKLKGVFGTGEGFFTLSTEGQGTLFVSSCGGIHKITLERGQEYVVDSDHLILWDKNMEYSTKLAGGGVFKSMFSGEGFVAKFVGPGDIYIQTRKPITITTNDSVHTIGNR